LQNFLIALDYNAYQASFLTLTQPEKIAVQTELDLYHCLVNAVVGSFFQGFMLGCCCDMLVLSQA